MKDKIAVDTPALLESLREVYRAQDRLMRERFQRSLPFQDSIIDRWERARLLGFEENASIYNSAIVYGDVRVGRNSWIGPYVVLDGTGGGVTIGEFCSISAGVHIYTHDTVEWALSGGRSEARRARVAIGDRCYVGSQSVIKAGVTIASHCVVAANSFVNRDVPERCIVGGSPARRIGAVLFDGDTPRLVYDTDAGAG